MNFPIITLYRFPPSLYARSVQMIAPILLAVITPLLAYGAALPIASKDSGLEPDDTVAFTMPDGSSAYIPEYRIATETVGITGGSQQQRYRMHLASDGPDWVLTIHLQTQPSPQLKLAPERLSKARPLTEPVPQVVLSYTVAAAQRNFRRERLFQNVLRESGGFVATLRLSKLDEQTELGTALTSPAAQAQLTVVRIAQVDVEWPFPDPAERVLIDNLQLAEIKYQRDEAAYLDLVRRLPANQAEFLEQMRQHLARQKDKVSELARQRSALQLRTRLVTIPLQLPQRMSPYPFELTQHPYAIQVQIKRDEHAIGLIQRAVSGRRYYQDAARTQRFYYLPDQFELVRDANGVPRFIVRATENDRLYRIEYMAEPTVTPGRLEKDRSRLAELVGLSPNILEFEPLPGDAFSVRLNLPQDGQWRLLERADAMNSLTRSFVDAVRLDAEDLRLLYDALFARIALFNGTITVKIGNWATENIPFIGQLTGDPEEVWQNIFDPSIPSAFRRQLQITANPRCFVQADMVSVMIEDRPAIELTRARANANTEVGQAMSDFILRRYDDGSFRYRLIRRVGAQIIDDGVRTGSGNALMLTCDSASK